MSVSIEFKSVIKKHWPLLAVGVIWFVVFFEFNTGQKVVGYRDSAYLYYPYFQWIDEVWQQGQIPLWNPYCDLGYPVVGDGTSSVYYPGKLIFLLRFLGYPACYGIYLSVHVLLAAFAAYLLALRLGASPIGAGIACFSYSFGGSTLFQVTNVVYLVSASWLPIGLLFVIGMIKGRSIHSAMGAALAASMMILGGDPQMAYLLGVIVAASMLIRLIWCRKKYRKWSIWFARLLFDFRGLIVFGLMAIALSAIQFLPSYVWAQQSVRTTQLGDLSFEWYLGQHMHAVYQFSQPPWTVAEMIWPNVSGKPFPIHQRWTNAFPGWDRVWNPSIYSGVFTIILALSGARFWRGNRRYVWLTWLAIFFALASFGWYGPVWLYKEIVLGLGYELDEIAEPVGAQVGGIYWMMTAVLPGFESFRYPAKLFVIASLAVSCLAGTAVSTIPKLNWRLIVSILSIATLSLCFWFNLVEVENYVGQHPIAEDVYFGPFETSDLTSRLSKTIFHSLIVLGLVVVVCFLVKYESRFSDSWLALIFVISIVDISVANLWLLAPVDSSVFTKPTNVAQLIRNERFQQGYAPRMISFWYPDDNWRKFSDANRLEEVITWQRESLHPKHHLVLPSESRIELVRSFTSIEHPTSRKWHEYCETSLRGDSQRSLVNGHISNNDPNNPVLRIVDRDCKKVRLIKSVKSGFDLENLLPRQELERAKGTLESIVETANRFSFTVQMDEASIVLCSVIPDAGWKVRVTDVEGTLVSDELRPAGKYHFAADVPAGQHTVEFYYSPIEFWIGLVVSSISWIVTAIFTLRLGFTGLRFFRF